jgi:DNA gyrase subunit A
VPYNVNPATVEERIAELVNDKQLTEISGLRNESDENTRLVIELKRDANTKVVLNKLFKLTQLETSFSVNMLAIDQRRPKTLNLKELISCYIEHRREVVIRRTKYLLRKAEERAEVLEGYLIALANMDDFIELIRESKNRDEAKIKLLGYEWSKKQIEHFGITVRNEDRLSGGRYSLTDKQVDEILNLRLYQLTGLERDKIATEYGELLETIKDLMDILKREQRVLDIIKKELRDIKAKHATPRRTELSADEGEMAIEDLIANEGVIITLTHRGLVKRTRIADYRTQRRGGSGVRGQELKEGATPEEADFVERLFSASTHDYLMFFTNTGRVYVERVHEIPEGTRAARGKNIANVLQMQATEKVVALLRVESKLGPQKEDLTWQQEQYVFFATKLGTVKKTELSAFANHRKGGIIAIGIDAANGDALIDVKLTNGESEVVLITKDGMSITFEEKDVRDMGRPAAGVNGIKLEKGDAVVAMALKSKDATLLVAGENGVGKRTEFEEYRVQTRAGKGLITMRTGDKTGRVVGALTVTDADEIMLMTLKGQMVRTPCKEIRETGRIAMGVRLINLDEGDKLLGIAPVINTEDDEADDDKPMI